MDPRRRSVSRAGCFPRWPGLAAVTAIVAAATGCGASAPLASFDHDKAGGQPLYYVVPFESLQTLAPGTPINATTPQD